jgi:hypothetical protein
VAERGAAGKRAANEGGKNDRAHVVLIDQSPEKPRKIIKTPDLQQAPPGGGPCYRTGKRVCYDSAMSATYHKLGVQFLYPENWELLESDPREDPRTITVQSDTGAFWSITLYSPAIDPASLAETALAALQEEYEELEVEPVSESIGGIPAAGFEVQFYVEQLVAAARIRVFEIESRLVLLLCQAEDREFDRLGPVFEAMTVSLLQHQHEH